MSSPHNKIHNIVIASVGGQGGLTLSRIIGYAAILEGYSVRIGETLGMSQRGGIVQSYVRIGKGTFSPIIPHGKANVILGLEPLEAYRAARIYSNREQTIIITNTSPIHTVTTLLGKEEYPPVSKLIDSLRNMCSKIYAFNATKIAKSYGLPRSVNIVMLAAYLKFVGELLSKDSLIEAIRQVLRRKVDENVDLFIRVINSLQHVMSP